MKAKWWMIALAVALTACSSKDEDPVYPDGTEEPPPDTSLEWLDDPTARLPHGAGTNYKEDRLELDAQVIRLMDAVGDVERKKAFAILTPHAGFYYSGEYAAEAYARVEVPDVVILLTTKHHNKGEPAAVWKDGPFITPGHATHIRKDLVDRFVELTDGDAVVDREAFVQKSNHPLENQLPFITTINPDAEIVPIAIHDHSNIHFPEWPTARIETWGAALAELTREIEAGGEEVLIVATTDLVHYIPLEDADEQDAQLMEHIIDYDIAGLHDYVVEQQITICGEIPTAVMMSAAQQVGARSELLAIGDSYPKLDDTSRVVGYPSAVFWPGGSQ